MPRARLRKRVLFLPGALLIFYALRPLVLASASPRRIDFLAELGLSARIIIPPQEAEPSPLPGEAPESYVLRAAFAKASSVLALPEYSAAISENPSAATPLVIAADTIVVLRNRILGKPRDPEHALDMLRKLAGKKHTVITGCALLNGGTSHTFAVQSHVHMWNCPENLLRAYALSGEPMDKAGAYAVQGMGAFLVERITGSWSNVVGLPVAELVQILIEMRAIGAEELGEGKGNF